MKQTVSKCPVCAGSLRISALRCSHCGAELNGDFELGIFDRLNGEQYKFLLTFLKSRGNLKEVQSALNISYPTAKRKLDELLISLELGAGDEKKTQEGADMTNLTVDYGSSKSSELIKAKLKAQSGHATVFTARGLPCEIYASADGETFTSDKLPITPPYRYVVFDVVTDLLLECGGKARKGNGRNYKLGEPGCEETTVVGAIAKRYFGRGPGESVFDPVFVLAAVLEWAGIVRNGRGELILTEAYKRML